MNVEEYCLHSAGDFFGCVRILQHKKVMGAEKQWIVVEAEVTAYCLCKKCCGKDVNNPNFGLTASGRRVKLGDNSMLVAAGRDILFGTQVIVPEYADGRPVKVLDRGGAITVGKIDVLFNASKDPAVNHWQARQWGRRKIKIFIEK
jgi:3D (Asp-Asp-Asp) domain-containing protein